LAVAVLSGLLLSIAIVLPSSRRSASSDAVRAQTPATVPAASTQPNRDARTLAAALEDPNEPVRRLAIAQIHELAARDERALSLGFPQWIDPLLDNKAYADIRQLAPTAINSRAFDVALVQKAMRAMVVSSMAQRDYDRALTEAKSYYSVVSLGGTSDALELIESLLQRTKGQSVSEQFIREQLGHGGSEWPADNVADSSPGVGAGEPQIMDTIGVDASVWQEEIRRLEERAGGPRQGSYGNLMARGNLLLLAGRPREARGCFESACRIAGSNMKQIREAIEGVARALRSYNANAFQADKFILNLREDPSLANEILSASNVPPLSSIQAAAEQVQLAMVQARTAPPAEIARQRAAGAAEGTNPTIQADFECGTQVAVSAVSASHLRVALARGQFGWFMFRIRGAAGRLVRIDLTGRDVEMDKWATLNPVYCDASELDDETLFATKPATEDKVPVRAWNGPLLPSTEAERWHFIQDVWQSKQDTLSFVTPCKSESVFVAMRVPYTPTYNEKYISALGRNPRLKVLQAGLSNAGRPLTVVQVGAEDSDKAKRNPCVVLYAREHADEPDSSWVAQGLIEYCAGNDEQAKKLRERVTFLVIPMVDPDAAAISRHQGIMVSFKAGLTTVESRGYAKWFHNWIADGGRIDLVLNLHNVQSKESPNLACALMAGAAERGAASAALNRILVERFRAANMSVAPSVWALGISTERLGGWLSMSYGPLVFAYEVNSQAPVRHLNLEQLKGMGMHIAEGIGSFVETSSAKTVLDGIEEIRRRRVESWPAQLKERTSTTVQDYIEAEAAVPSVVASVTNGERIVD
jgi:hypothetical protein